ncbi:translation elongation factor Ts [Myxococcus sp. CA051A]|uniref:Elongation factor Ts n=1 Tax=Myxococcus llanfairpwllgwyngyllgogerychwyrndrobwllllantysiliogogogochensis TaxID=2590453 RepID=A0A540WUL3_9BACT|nr:MULTISPECIES: translation elongation factor Ts [Myxococcus]NTX00984.1 translation elongation factor Ts [Myxococcus sp. CA040A]NTX12310.1 translation elongation factor Ts [Myxococcus sp. CA056]NTX33327.1 translation elongation factor Ts [Myxococcus sp. CA033]NTX55076.1 translation elongation factor Ts [Myxococcus sp. CA039A]NTX59609.1 translation elongation factor Ts [Myxococcus sp. CA051A]
MAEITAQMVKDLRERTSAPMMDCKKALTETGGDFAKAEEWLRKKGISKAAGKEGRVAAEGLVGTYVHGGRIGVLVEVNCETDFVARNPDFQDLVKEVAMQIAATGPKFVRREEVPTDNMEKEREIQRDLLKQQGKPEAMLDKILVGKMEKYYEQVCLVDQLWVKDDKKKVGDMITERAAKIGEKVSVRRFVRFEVGEGIEKKKDDLAAEVAKTLQG